MKTILSFLTALTIACSANSQDSTTVTTETPEAPQGGASTTATQGVWGGQGIQMRVGSSSSTYELDCAHGIVSEPFTGDANGNFSLDGTIIIEHGGPVHPGEVLPHFNAHYSGQFTSSQMQLMIDYTNEDGHKIHDVFDLRSGSPGVVHKCL